MSTRSIFSLHADVLIKIRRELLFHSLKSSSDNVAFNKSRLKRKIGELTLTYADYFSEVLLLYFIWNMVFCICLEEHFSSMFAFGMVDLKLSPCYMGKARCLLGHESHIYRLHDESYLLATCTLTWSFCSFIKINTESHFFFI